MTPDQRQPVAPGPSGNSSRGQSAVSSSYSNTKSNDQLSAASHHSAGTNGTPSSKSSYLQSRITTTLTGSHSTAGGSSAPQYSNQTAGNRTAHSTGDGESFGGDGFSGMDTGGDGSAVKCPCNNPAVVRIVRKEGPNQGMCHNVH